MTFSNTISRFKKSLSIAKNTKVLFFGILSLFLLSINILSIKSVVYLDMYVSGGTRGQIFWKNTEAYSEKKSTSFDVKSGERRVYKIEIPTYQSGSLRIDPTNDIGVVEVYGIKIKNIYNLGGLNWDYKNRFSNWSIFESINNFSIKDKKLKIIATSNDSGLENININYVNSRFIFFLDGVYIIFTVFLIFRYRYKIISILRICGQKFKRLAIGCEKNKVIIFLNRLGDEVSEKKLIIFDFKTISLLFFVVVVFGLLVFLKINYSAISFWNKAVPGNESLENASLFGEGKSIRGDEWFFVTPAMLSQANQEPKFPIINESLGAAMTPLVTSLPVAHFSTLFRPQNWGFFLFDTERAYSFYWNFKVFGLFLSFFLLLMLLTRSNFWISFLGSLWLFFSGFIQWWFSTPAMLPEMITSFCIVFVASAYLVFSEKKKVVVLSSLLMTIFGINFILFFYPPFQIPLVYLAFFLFAGYVLKNFEKGIIKKILVWRLMSFGMLVFLSMFFLYLFYCDAKETIGLIMNTAYPGRRFELGGNMNMAWGFSGYFSFFWNENNFPKILVNICEASNFVLFFPIIILSIGLRVVKEKAIKKETLDQLFLTGYILLVLVWVFLGFNHLVAKMSLFYMVQPERSFLGLGVANIILVAMYLSWNKEKYISKNNMFFLVSIFFVSVLLLGFYSNKQIDPSYYAVYFVILMSFFVLFLAWALINKKKFLFFIPLLSLLILPNFPINPIMKGLRPIYDKDIVRYVIKMRSDGNGEGKWLVLGDPAVANLLKTVGVDVINGSNYLPDFNRNKILDPQQKYINVFNRYSNVIFESSDNEDKVVFNLIQKDAYTVSASLCSKAILDIGAKFFVIPNDKKNINIGCLKLITSEPLNNVNIFTYED